MINSTPTVTAIDMQSYSRRDWFDYFWTTHSAAQLQFTRRLASIPGFIVDNIQEEACRMKLAISLRVYHALRDGCHVGHRVHNMQRHLDDPTLIQPDYQSYFESTAP